MLWVIIGILLIVVPLIISAEVNVKEAQNNQKINIESLNDTIRSFMRKAKEEQGGKNYKTSIEYWTEYINLCNSHPYESVHGSGYRERAEVYMETGEYENAINDYTTIITLNRDDCCIELNEDLYRWRGIAYFKLKKYQKSIEDFSASINHWMDLQTSNYMQINANNIKDAIDELKSKTPYISDDNSYLIKDLMEAFYIRGIAYYNLKKFEEAIEDFKLIIEKYTKYKYKDVDILLNMAANKENGFSEITINTILILKINNANSNMLVKEIGELTEMCPEAVEREIIKQIPTDLIDNISCVGAEIIINKFEKLGATLELKEKSNTFLENNSEYGYLSKSESSLLANTIPVQKNGLYDVLLTEVPEKCDTIQVLRKIREIKDCDLSSAKVIMENTPSIIEKNIEYPIAIKIKENLEKTGVIVKVQNN